MTMATGTLPAMPTSPATVRTPQPARWAPSPRTGSGRSSPISKPVKEYAWTDSEEITEIKTAILCHGPLTACSGNWWHCVDIVGWQGSEYDANGGWIVRNSWGTGWLSNGYGVLKYGSPLSTNKDEQLLGDIAMDAWYVQGVYHG